MKNSALFAGLLAILMSFSLAAQEETTDPSADSQRNNEDSLSVVVPSKGVADLSLITPPEGFEPTDLFNGYMHSQASSGIIMTMVENANYIKISEGMTDDFFKQNGLEFISKEEFTSDNGISGIHYKFSFTTSEVPFIRYMVYAGDLNKTLWLNITYPEKLEGLIEGEILKAIQSIKLNVEKDER